MRPSLRVLTAGVAVLIAVSALPARAQEEDERERIVVGTLRSVGADAVDVDGQVVRVAPDVPMRDPSGAVRGWRDLRAHVGETIQILVDDPETPRPAAQAIMLGPPPR